MMAREHGHEVEHPLVHDYLQRLRAESARLPADDAHELYADISEHLHTALAGTTDEAEIRNQLDRTGSPAQLVDEAGGGRPDTSRSSADTGRGLLLGAVIALIGAEVGILVLGTLASLPWIAGLVMLGLARTPTLRVKVRGFLALGTGFPLLVVLLTTGTGGESCTSSATRVGGRWVSEPEVCTSTGPGPWLPITVGVLLLAYLVWQALTVRALLKGRG